jgi:glycogen debranching enzyme
MYMICIAIFLGISSKKTFKEWSRLLKDNFEKHFWINVNPTAEYETHPEMINRRGIYKDSYFAKPFWADFQLRPNFPVAMVVVSRVSYFDYIFKSIQKCHV